MDMNVLDVVTSAGEAVLFIACALAALLGMVKRLLLLEQGLYNKSRYSCLEEAQDMAFREVCEVAGLLFSLFAAYLILCAINSDLMYGNVSLSVRP